MKLILPQNLVKVLGVLFVVLALAIYFISQKKRKELKYITIRDSYGEYDTVSNHDNNASYHDSGVLPFPKLS